MPIKQLLNFNINLGREIEKDKRKWIENSIIPLYSRVVKTKTFKKTESGLDVKSTRIINYISNPTLREIRGDKDIQEKLINSDDEVDLELIGKAIGDLTTIYQDSQDKLCYNFAEYEVKYTPAGEQIPCEICIKNGLTGDKAIYCEHRFTKQTESNINGEKPVMWIKNYELDKLQLLKTWSFEASYQLYHTDGAQFGILYDMAKKLQESQKMVLVATIIEKRPQPLIMRNGGRPFFGWLEGRTQNGNYALILHKTSLKLV